MTIAQLRTFMDKVNADEGAYPCKYGHSSCALRQGGRCSDEVWLQQCSDESEEDYESRLEENDFLEEE